MADDTWKNKLYFGDNLDVLRRHIGPESVDLIYLDPPFNSSRSYNVLFKEMSGASSDAQIEAFDDTWHWGQSAASAYEQVIRGSHQQVAGLLRAMVEALGHNDVTAYLSMMAVRLVELHRVLKPTGSIYLHCDPTASHYLKILMDGLFNPDKFRNEVIWERTTGRKGISQFGRVHDVIFFYTKSHTATWNPPTVPQAADTARGHDLIRSADGTLFRFSDLTGGGPGPARQFGERGMLTPPSGRHWAFDQDGIDRLLSEGRIAFTTTGRPRIKTPLEELSGVAVRDVWTDIDPINSAAHERLGYPTQKPLTLLERIINASSNEGDLVLDPFCGCGTAAHAAQKLRRRWIGIDITHLAIGLIRRRILDAFPNAQIDVVGEPTDLAGAQDLAARDKYQFQWWALDRLGAQPIAGKKKGMDRGIDGVIPFFAGTNEDYKRVIVSVKGGEHVTSSMIRDLDGVLSRENEPIGVLLTLTPPTREMSREANAHGFYHSDFWQKDYPRLQIVTVADLLDGRFPQMPPSHSPFAQAPREREAAVQRELGTKG